MDMKMNEFQVQQAMYGEAQPSHGGSFSSASGSAGYSSDPFTPVSGRSSPDGSQRLSDYDVAAASFSGGILDLTPPPSASVPYFPLSMTANTGAAPMPMSATASMPGLHSGYMSSASFQQTPATPDRNHSFSSQMSATSPASPGGHMLSSSYPASVSSMSSMTSVSSMASGSPHQDALCGPATPEAYVYPEMSVKSHLQNQQPLPMPFQHRPHQQPPSAFVFPTPPPHQPLANDCSDLSPSEFCWNNRPESPAINYFGDRPSLPPPPPSATLRSSVVKQESSEASYYSPPGRTFSSASSGSYAITPTPMRRQLRYTEAQMTAKALQEKMSADPTHHNYNSHADSAGGTIIMRNGIKVSKVASGAFKCVMPGCPSRPFKRSEHLKRHVTTHHENKDQFPCKFCGRQFNRKDNWRSHLKLHTVARGKNARTDFHAEAVNLYEVEMAKITKCRARKDVDVYANN